MTRARKPTRRITARQTVPFGHVASLLGDAATAFWESVGAEPPATALIVFGHRTTTISATAFAPDGKCRHRVRIKVPTAVIR